MCYKCFFLTHFHLCLFFTTLFWVLFYNTVVFHYCVVIFSLSKIQLVYLFYTWWAVGYIPIFMYINKGWDKTTLLCICSRWSSQLFNGKTGINHLLVAFFKLIFFQALIEIYECLRLGVVRKVNTCTEKPLKRPRVRKTFTSLVQLSNVSW